MLSQQENIFCICLTAPVPQCLLPTEELWLKIWRETSVPETTVSCLLCPVPFLLLTLYHPFPAFCGVKEKLRSASEGFPAFVA